MPYVDQVGTVQRLTAVATYINGQVEEWSVHMLCTVAVNRDSRLDLCNNIVSQVTAHILPTLSENTTFIGCRASTRFPYPAYTPVIAQVTTVGTAVADALPTQDRMLISLRTAYSGRIYRGRVYGWTVAQTMIDNDSLPSTTCITAWNQAFANIINTATYGGSTWVPCIWHYRKPPLVQVDPTPVTGYTVKKVFATQRRSGSLGRVNAAPW